MSEASRENICSLHLLTTKQFNTITKRYDSITRSSFRNSYCKIVGIFNKICNKCQMSQFTKEEEMEVLNDIEFFLILLSGEIVPQMEKSCEVRSAIILMLCSTDDRCMNQAGFSNLNRSFLNWISHILSTMGNSRIGITHQQFLNSNLRGTRDTVIVKVRKFLTPKLQKLFESSDSPNDFINDLSFAQRCYERDYQTRELRAPEKERIGAKSRVKPPSPPGICGERLAGDHLFPKDLAFAQNIVISEFMDSVEMYGNC